jgi:lipoate-protein ligase A
MEKQIMWRVITETERDISELHALEEVLLEKVDRGESPPIVVLSTISPEAISLSYKQNYNKDLEVKRCLEEGIKVTRRQTGGRSMYFDKGYLIMSVVARVPPNYRDVGRIYDLYCGKIIDALNHTLKKEFRIENVNDLCLSDGRKIGGAAQRVTKNAALIHCYVRYEGDVTRMCELTKIDNISLAPYAEELNKMTVSAKEVCSISRKTFSEGLLIQFFYGEKWDMSCLSAEEQQLINEKKQLYDDFLFVIGTGKEKSRGNCDLIAGDKLKIKDLESKVTFV